MARYSCGTRSRTGRFVKDEFRGYYPPTGPEYGELWTSALIVLDTNSLLNLYRYSETTRQQFIDVLSAFQDRLWIPAQVAQEFLDRRFDVIHDQTSAFTAVREILSESQKAFESGVGRYKRHSTLDVDALVSQFESAVGTLIAELDSKEDAHTLDVAQARESDSIWDKVSELYAGRVGARFPEHELESIYKEGAKRYAAEVPPGYKDAKKGAPGMFGDLVLWKQLLLHASVTGQPAIFVTDDSKEDWWRIFRGQKIGPRPELVHEFYAVASQKVHFYSPEQFSREARERGAVGFTDEALGEVKEVSSEAGERLRLIAERRLHELERRRTQLKHLSQRSQDRMVGLADRPRLLAERESLLRQLADLEAAYAAAMHQHSKGLPSEAGSVQRVLDATRKRAHSVEMRLQDAEKLRIPSVPHGHYVEELNKLEAEIAETEEALAEFPSVEGGALPE